MVTKEMLKNVLTQLAFEKGMVLEVHSSLSSFGELEGGAETVINTLKEIVTEEGSIFMPALRLSRELPLTEEDKKLGISLVDGRVIHVWDMVRVDDYLGIEKLTALTGDHPKYLGWVALERVLDQKP